MRNAFECGLYLIELFQKTNLKCGTTKVQKLLVISQVASLIKRKKVLFENDIVFQLCGFGVQGLDFSYEICGFIENDTLLFARSVKSNLESERNSKYFLYNGKVFIDSDEQEILCDVFDRFGSFKARTLGDLLSEWTIHSDSNLNVISPDIISSWVTAGMPCKDKKDNLLTGYLKELESSD